MASYTVADDEFGAWEKTMAGAGDTVTFQRDVARIRVTNVNGTASIFFRTDGTAPTVGSGASKWIPAVAGAHRELQVLGGGETVVKLDSSGTPSYSVEEV